MSYLTLVVLLACAIAVVTDVRSRSIPNWLTFGLAFCAIVVQAFSGPSAVLVSVIIYVAVMILGSVVFALGWLGGGDVKLLAAAAAAFGWPDCVVFLIYTSIGGGILALTVSAARGRLFTTVAGALAAVRPLAYGNIQAVAPRTKTVLPYGCAIALGAAAVALADSVAPFLRLPL
jgi:prepilin peptidase CpaA